jgi:hypothetical protein
MTDKSKWSARGATFKARALATKAVWFPPEPTPKSGKDSAAKAKKTTKSAGKAARRTT